MKSKSASYPQPEGTLGDTMLKGAAPLEGSSFGESRLLSRGDWGIDVILCDVCVQGVL